MIIITKIVLTISFDRDIANWLMEKKNRSIIVNEAMRQYLEFYSDNSKINIDKRMAEMKQEYEVLKAKKQKLIEEDG